MATAASQLSFEVLRFGAEPVSAEVALLDVEGRFRAGTRRRLGVPRLVAEDARGSGEIAPAVAAEATAEPDGSLWRASFAVAIDELGGTVFSLAVGRELLLGLPAPDIAGASGDREVRLAREANALRRTTDEARDAAAAALASAWTERSAREGRPRGAAGAETEGMRRELERERERAAAAASAIRRGRVTEIAGEPVNGDEHRTAPLTRGGSEHPAPPPAGDDETARVERSGD